MNFKRFFLAILLIGFSCLASFGIEEKSKAPLALNNCIEMAIKNSPIIKKNIYNLEIAKNNVGVAKSVYFPTLNAETGVYQEYNSNSKYLGANNSLLPTAQITLSQLLWNFGKSNSLIKKEKFYQLVGEYYLTDSIYKTVFDVKRNYYAVLRAKARVDIEEDFLKILEANLERSEKIAHKGKVEKSDMINSKSLLTDEKIRVIDAHNEYKNALIDLANSLYINNCDIEIQNNDYFKPYVIETPNNLRNDNDNDLNKSKLAVEKLKKRLNAIEEYSDNSLPFTTEKAYKIALKNSPDIWALNSAKSATEASLNYIKKQYYPDMTGDVGYNFTNYNRNSNHAFFMGLNLKSSVNMKQLKHEIDIGKAQISLAENAINLYEKDLYFDIERCYVNVLNAEKQIPITFMNIVQALENFALADECYEQGLEDYNLLQDARNGYLNAQNLYIETLYDYNIKLIDLENAMHYHIDGMHELVRNIKPYISKDNLEHYENLINYNEGN